MVNCEVASVLEAVLHCLSWTAFFTFLLLLLWPLLQNRHSKLIMFFMVLVTSLGPSPQSSKPCQQSCCTVCLVRLALWTRKISLWWPHKNKNIKPPRKQLHPEQFPILRWYKCHCCYSTALSVLYSAVHCPTTVHFTLHCTLHTTVHSSLHSAQATPPCSCDTQRASP